MINFFSKWKILSGQIFVDKSAVITLSIEMLDDELGDKIFARPDEPMEAHHQRFLRMMQISHVCPKRWYQCGIHNVLTEQALLHISL